ncbi:hypothetical protein EDD17DRAFT_1534643 [Pisolithus thermaeus]|nr:hypothetical protein EDD17DRAFT_1534643 [Pisolithus thermaeus]
MAPVPQNSVIPTLHILSDESFYQSDHLIIAAVGVSASIISLTISRQFPSVARPLSRSHRPLSNFFVRRREPPSLPAGTPYKRYRTTPLSIGVPHPSSDNMRSVDTDRSWPPFSSFYATDGYSKETLPVYDSVGSAPHYEEAERTFNEPSTVQPSSGGPSVPPPVYQGLQNS